MSLWEIENHYFSENIRWIAGTDEAGAGPLAGPVYAGAVILPVGLELPYLNDSKQVTPKRRETLYDQIKAQAIAWAVAEVTPKEIDELDILNARMLAMQRAIDRLDPVPEFVLVDGNRDHGSRCSIRMPHAMIVKGDSLSASIAAASILAKVTRDRVMDEMDQLYPGYGFAKHKGYPTKAHYQALDALGPCPIHRTSFLAKWRGRQR